MGLCLINHVDPLCFTSKAAVFRTHQCRPESFEKEIGYRLGSSEYTRLAGFDGSHVKQTMCQQIMMSPGILELTHVSGV